MLRRRVVRVTFLLVAATPPSRTLTRLSLAWTMMRFWRAAAEFLGDTPPPPSPLLTILPSKSARLRFAWRWGGLLAVVEKGFRKWLSLR